MVRPSEELLLAWSSLTGSDSASGWQAIALSSAGPIEVRAGRRSPDNAEAILLDFPAVGLAPAAKLPEGQGFSVERAEPDLPGSLRLALTRRSAGGAELFAAMACDVLGVLDDAASDGAADSRLLRLFLGRLSAWQEFMRKGSQTLSPEAEVGLVGELAALRAIVDAGVAPATAVESWIGPLDGIRDFEVGTGAIEVKATLSGAGFPARIGSLDQLDDSVRQPLYLAGVRLHQSESGQSLPDWVAALRDVCEEGSEARRLFNERLIAAGFADAHASHYIRRFTLVDARFVEVTEGFPRLTPASVPLGITRAIYEIDLDKVASARVSVADALKKLGAI
jgi:hypothetical protein